MRVTDVHDFDMNRSRIPLENPDNSLSSNKNFSGMGLIGNTNLTSSFNFEFMGSMLLITL